jgi:hypothetical protein
MSAIEGLMRGSGSAGSVKTAALGVAPEEDADADIAETGTETEVASGIASLGMRVTPRRRLPASAAPRRRWASPSSSPPSEPSASSPSSAP